MRLHRIVEDALSRLDGWSVSRRDSRGVEITDGRRVALIGWRDTTGRVGMGLIEAWLSGAASADERHYLTMGWFPAEVKAAALSRLGPRGLHLYQMGLRDYFDERLRPEVTSPGETEVSAAIVGAIRGAGLGVEYSGCRYCGSRAVASCEVCGALLCARHAMRCPICGAVTCHPDTGATCFYEHGRGGGI